MTWPAITATPTGVGHGFVLAGGVFSTVDVAGARGTQLTRIKNSGQVTGVCFDVLNGVHGVVGQ
ncbi:MAG TPA: hypothetical protein VHT50_05635 [Mycobacterium sp.]|nr:hypothetical protein [Mycobacterium sp.]